MRTFKLEKATIRAIFILWYYYLPFNLIILSYFASDIDEVSTLLEQNEIEQMLAAWRRNGGLGLGLGHGLSTISSEPMSASGKWWKVLSRAEYLNDSIDISIHICIFVFFK